MPKIFISYRREDSSYPAGAIARRLSAVFGKNSVVLDVDNIPPGQDFRDYIKHELDACDLFLAVIGRNWLTTRDEHGQTRLENINDWVRLELEAALRRESKIPVIPVLLDNVPAPKVEQLPDSLKDLAYRQAHSIRPPLDFEQDLERLIEKIKDQQRAQGKHAQKAGPLVGAALRADLRRPLVIGGGALSAVIAIVLAIVFFKSSDTPLNAPPMETGRRPIQSDTSADKSRLITAIPQPVPAPSVMPSSSPVLAPAAGPAPSVDGPSSVDRGAPPPPPPSEKRIWVTAPPVPMPRADGPPQAAGRTDDNNSLNTKVVWIPAGTFMMGSPKDEKGRDDDETQVQVALTRGFWLGQHEVTQSEWQRVMQTTPWTGQANVQQGPDYPATNVTWDDAMKFCDTLTKQERSGERLLPEWRYTLPTEAQWEYACRAGTTTRFCFGDDDSKLGEYGWFKTNADDAGEGYPHRVGLKKPNPWGLHDMHGNVIEWCRDWSHPKLPGGIDPQGLSAGTNRVERGGNYVSPANHCRSAQRNWEKPIAQHGMLGFRLAIVPAGS